jgi:hypothetical protein
MMCTIWHDCNMWSFLIIVFGLFCFGAVVEVFWGR